MTQTAIDPVAAARWDAVRELHHRYFVGLVLYVLQREGTAVAAEMMKRTFERQRGQKFLDSVAKLGLAGLPPQEIGAKYLFLANGLGGVKVECAVPGDGTAWIRYPVPRWMYDGTAICAIPVEVSTAPMRGFHSRIGESLGVESLGYVCVGQTALGHAGLEGYFYDAGRPLAPEEKLRFDYDAPRPVYDPAQFPKVDWPEERLLKVRRNYAVTYVTNVLPALISVVGAERAAELGHGTGLRIGLHYHETLTGILGPSDDFAGFIAALLDGMDEAPARDGTDTVIQPGWKMMRGREAERPALLRAWSGLIEGLLLAHDRTRKLEVASEGDAIRWTIR